MNELSSTTHGRILSVGILVALTGGGISATMHDATGIALMCVSLLGSVVLTLTALAMAIDKRPAFVAISAIILPLVFFLYAVGLTVSIHHHARWAAYGFIAIGLAFGANAVRGLGGSDKSDTAAAH